MNTHHSHTEPLHRMGILALLAISTLPLRADVLPNLDSLPSRYSVGHPDVDAEDGNEGPKGIATADFNGDGKPDLAVSNLDGTATILLQNGDGFEPPMHLKTGDVELRGVLAADLNGDGWPDLAVAAPRESKIVVYFNSGTGNFGTGKVLAGWKGVRALASGDFDGDGIVDLAAAGPGFGVRHFRGIGNGNFVIVGDLPQLSPTLVDLARPRPVYSMHAMPSRDGLRDDLLVTNADTPALWILSTVPVDYSREAPVDTRNLPQWKNLASPVLIHEVQALNSNGLRDADGSAGPWAELINRSEAPVDLAGWKLKLQSAEWIFPSVILPPGHFLIVYLSGKNRSGTEYHTSFQLKESTGALNLLRPDGTLANMIDLPPHTVADVSRGLSPSSDEIKWFDIPSPGAANNAGLGSLGDSSFSAETELTLTPPEPAQGQSVTVQARIPERPLGNAFVRYVWFAASPGAVEEYHLLYRRSQGVFDVTLPPGAFAAGRPYRVLALLRNDRTGNDFTVEMIRSTDGAADSGFIAPQPGSLRLVASVPTPKVKAFDLGAVTRQATIPGVLPDLVLADDEGGKLVVLRGTPGFRRFDPIPVKELRLDGSPRDVRVADTDGDGWNDATAVIEAADVAVVCRNDGGTLRATGELSTGSSPRELVMEDFTGDGLPDAAVINRKSADVSILPSSAGLGGLVTNDQTYHTDGDVGGLKVADFNGDGRDDILQLHRASGEISIRFALENGLLGPSIFWSLGVYAPGTVAIADVNGDDLLDVLSANLGRDGNGSISVLLGLEGGGFGDLRIIATGDPLFAIAVDDFDNDGDKDVVAGLWDCRVMFFSGDGEGQFIAAYEAPIPFGYDPRHMVTGDFDRDGDVDIATVSLEGELITLTNPGPDATVAQWAQGRSSQPPRSAQDFGAERIVVTELNGDGDWDLIIGSGNGVIVYVGGAGMDFTLTGDYTTESEMKFPVSDLLAVDPVGNDPPYWVVACRVAACVNILTQDADGRFHSFAQADVPAARYLAVGDLDADGKPDLVGSGDSLWTVLSGRTPVLTLPGSTETNRPPVSGVLINEVLARNTGIPVPSDNLKKTDFIELFNSTSEPAVLDGWRLQVQSTQEGIPVDENWTFPALTLGPSQRVVLICAPAPNPPPPGDLHTGFVLPAEGGLLTLTQSDNVESDRVTYLQSTENVAWSRFLDGHASFHADSIPSPGSANQRGVPVPPEAKLSPPTPSAIVANEPIRFTVRSRDDIAILAMSLIWNRLDAPHASPQRLILYDDGMHGDGKILDGIFSNVMGEGLFGSSGFPPGAAVQFYLEAEDVSGAILRLPDNATLSAPGVAPVAWSISITNPPALRIAEVCSDNLTRLRDERGGSPDYVRIENFGSTDVDLGNVLLGRSPLDTGGSEFRFPSGSVLSPGGSITVFADNDLSEGPLHAPFTLDAAGDDISLVATTPSGARQWIQSLTLPPMNPDARLLRLGTSDYYGLLGADADPQFWTGSAWDGDGNAMAAANFRAAAGSSYIIQGDAPGPPVAWSTVASINGDGALHTIARGLGEFSALRIEPNEGPPSIVLEAVLADTTRAGFFGTARGASAVTLYYGLSNAGFNSAGWDASMTSSGSRIEFFPPELEAGKRYYFALKATTPSSPLWRGGAFQTRPSAAPEISSLAFGHRDTTESTVKITVSPPSASISAVSLVVGRNDRFGSSASQWPQSVDAQSVGNGKWIATVSGLERETNYFYRAVIHTATSGVLPPSALRLHASTLGATANLIENLRISEIMFNPRAPTREESDAGFFNDDFEFLELHNDSSESMDLSGLWFSGIYFDFPPTGAPVLPPDVYAVIAANPHAFAMRYGADIPLAGWTLHPFRKINKLSNGGERLTVRTGDGTLLLDFAYDDSAADTQEKWLADGYGYSLVYSPLDGTRAEGAGDYFISRRFGGSPGRESAAGYLTYEEWSTTHFGTDSVNPLIAGLKADPDDDRLNNLMEWVAGTDPVHGTASILRITGRQNWSSLHFTLNSDRLQPGLMILEETVVTGGRPGIWKPAVYYLANYPFPISGGGWDSVPRTLSADGHQVRLTVHVYHEGPSPSRYFRLKTNYTP